MMQTHVRFGTEKARSNYCYKYKCIDTNLQPLPAYSLRDFEAIEYAKGAE